MLNRLPTGKSRKQLLSNVGKSTLKGINYLKNVFNDKNFQKWAGCALVVSGAVLTTVNIYPLNLIVLNSGTLLYMIWSWRVKEMSVFVVNLCLTLIYTFGIMLNSL